jgi:hypothetical protein
VSQRLRTEELYGPSAELADLRVSADAQST